MRWRVALCSCDATSPIDPVAIRQALNLDAVPELFARLPHEQRQRFVDWLEHERPDRLVVGCCASGDLVREAAGAAGLAPRAVDILNLPEACFWAHPEPTAANTKAARLLRATMHAVPTAPSAEVPVSVGPTVLIAGGSPTAVALARRLSADARPLLVLEEGARVFDDGPLPWQVYRGRVAKVEGALGAFEVTVEHRPRIVPRVARELIPAGQVVMIGGDGVADGRPAAAIRGGAAGIGRSRQGADHDQRDQRQNEELRGQADHRSVLASAAPFCASPFLLVMTVRPPAKPRCDGRHKNADSGPGRLKH